LGTGSCSEGSLRPTTWVLHKNVRYWLAWEGRRCDYDTNLVFVQLLQVKREVKWRYKGWEMNGLAFHFLQKFEWYSFWV
jgi:hypothetical protein